MVSLNHSNIQLEIQKYLKEIDAIDFPERRGNNIEYMLSLKRGKILKDPILMLASSKRLIGFFLIL